jgi:hypothetical protein
MQESGNDEDGSCRNFTFRPIACLSLPDRLLGSGTVSAFLNLDF